MRIGNDKRDEILEALRIGTVPSRGLEALAVGLSRLETPLDELFGHVGRGHGALKALRGEYGAGKTFAARWLQERALTAGFATSEVQVSENETPLYRLETVYRRLMERLSTPGTRTGALGNIVETWLARLERDAIAGGTDANDEVALEAAITALLESRLASVSAVSPTFATVMRAIHHARFAGDVALQTQLLAWLAGQPNVAAEAKRAARIKGEIDHFGALGFLRGLLVVLRDAGYRGLVFVLDEVETLQRSRSDSREKSLNALRQLADELSAGHYGGLLVVLTGTASFFDGPTGVQMAPALASRLHTDFGTDARFDNPRAPQIRLAGFDRYKLAEVGRRVRDIYADGAQNADRVRALCDDALIADLAASLGGRFGTNVAVAPRTFLKKLVADVLDRIELFDNFDPQRDYKLTLKTTELNDSERAYASVDDVEL